MTKKLFIISLLTIFSIKLVAQNIVGIDVYALTGNGTITWSSVYSPGNKTFAYVKATKGVYNGYTCADGGTGYTDGEFYTNMVSTSGIVKGAYHFALPEDNSATD